ncbi:MAG: type II secretion system protein [Campylobacterales bacterium]|nr:type II secretion system protein [Campylobacterales bacterium]
MKKVNNKKAFTLIELIFVIVVIGILASFALPKFNETREAAVAKTIKQDISTIATSIKSRHALKSDILDISDAVELNTDTWTLDSTKLKVEYKISNATCVSIEVDKASSTHKLNVTITPTSSTLCQKIADDGVANSSEDLY